MIKILNLKSFVKFLLNFDLYFLIGYLYLVHAATKEFYMPDLDPQKPLNVYFLFVAVMVFVILGLKFSGLIKKNESIFSLIRSESIEKVVLGVGFISGLFISISIVFALVQYWDHVAAAGSFGFRAVSTSLHRLVPFESRWIFLFGPWILFLSPQKKYLKVLRFICFIFWIFLLFVTQTKFNYIFVIFIYLIWAFTVFKNSPLKTIMSGIFLLVFVTIGLKINMSKSIVSIETVLGDKKISTIAPNTWENTQNWEICSPYKDHPKKSLEEREKDRETALDSYTKIYNSLIYRIFSTSSRVSWVYYCLRDVSHWEPQFRGHQIFRFLGGYKPVYRWIMNVIDEDYGATAVSSAVANVVADSYLNAGYLGTILSAVVAGSIWYVLHLYSGFLYIWYLRILFSVILTTQGIITGSVVFLFLVMMYLFSLILNKVEKV